MNKTKLACNVVMAVSFVALLVCVTYAAARLHYSWIAP